MTSKSKMLLRWHQIIGASLTLALLFLSGCSSLNPASIHNTASLEPAPIQVQPAKERPPRTHYQSALAEIKAGNMDMASREVKLALQENPLDASSHFLLGCLLEREGEHDQTLILSGLSQRESHTGVSGVPILRDIPILKYLFSTRSTTVSDLAVIILLTPRDPAFAGERNRIALEEYINMRRAFIKAKQDALRICSTFKNATRTGKIKYPTVSPHTSLC